MLPTSESTSRSCTSLPNRAADESPDRVGRDRVGGRLRGSSGSIAARSLPRTDSSRLVASASDAAGDARASARRGCGAGRRATPTAAGRVGDVSDSPSPTRRASPTPAGTRARKASAPSSMPARPANARRLELAAGPVRRTRTARRGPRRRRARPAARRRSGRRSRHRRRRPRRHPTSSCPADELGERRHHGGVVVDRRRAVERDPRGLGALTRPRCRGRTAPRGGRTRTRTGTRAARRTPLGGRARRSRSRMSGPIHGSGVRPADCQRSDHRLVGRARRRRDGRCRRPQLVRVRVALGRGSVRATSGR